LAAIEEKLNRKLGLSFINSGLLSQAVTHRSYSGNNNERLEFLGDAILNFLIAEDLFRRFPTAKEGKLSRLRAGLVKRETLAEIAREIGLGEFLLLGQGEQKSGGSKRDSILADALEAIIGALFIDRDVAVVRDWVAVLFKSRLEGLSVEDPQKDFKTRLQEYLQANRCSLPQYSVVSAIGKAHARTFHVECATALLETPAVGSGNSRRIAEQEAAAQALKTLGVDS